MTLLYILVQCFNGLNREIMVIRREEADLDWMEQMGLRGIVISPGPRAPRDVHKCLDIIDRLREEFLYWVFVLGISVLVNILVLQWKGVFF